MICKLKEKVRSMKIVHKLLCHQIIIITFWIKKIYKPEYSDNQSYAMNFFSVKIFESKKKFLEMINDFKYLPFKSISRKQHLFDCWEMHRDCKTISIPPASPSFPLQEHFADPHVVWGQHCRPRHEGKG